MEAAIQKTGLFSKVVSSDTGEYRLDVQLIELKQPIIGLNFEVVAKTEWRLRKSLKDAPFWRETVVTPYTAKVSDSLYGVHRLRLANEGAIRENIDAGLAKIAELEL